MANHQNTNPFLDEESILAEDTVSQTIKPEEHTEFTFDSLAARLLKENLFLTALELHTELTESGREIPRLRDYFSNPGNFERTKDDITSPTLRSRCVELLTNLGLERASSIQTFDSLDFARYSDDGGGQVDERVAVLEFELRKAQDTIKSLRASLTKEAETDLVPSDQANEDKEVASKDDLIKPLERKALNFLVNEYLLQNNYKLTSVTFSEENEEQDFEDWDDVGLNMPRPPDLLHLYKDFGSHTTPAVQMKHAESMACFEEDEISALREEHRLACQELEIRISQLEIELDCCKIEKDQLMLQLEDFKSQKIDNDRIIHSTPLKATQSPPPSEDVDRHSLNMTEETVDNGMFSIREMGDGSETLSVNQMPCDSVVNPEPQESTNQNEVINSNSENQTSCTVTNRQVEREATKSPDIRLNRENSLSRKSSKAFDRALRDVCFHVSKDNRLIKEVSEFVGSDTDAVVLMLSRCLPHIVPNVLLAKREELIPLIICTAMLHPKSKDRDKLLNILFNLIKKPDEEQRNMILNGIVAFAQHVGQQRLEEELLPQCWEQISHKYPERRILVAEACGALSPYIPNELLSSLVLSMLQQMLMDDKDDDVREAVIRSLGLIVGFIQNPDKYSQAYELLKIALKDTSEKVVIATQQVFLPSFAMWALDLDKLQHNLIHSLLKDLEEMCAAGARRASTSQTIPLNEGRFLLLLSSLRELITFLYLSVITTGPYLQKNVDCDIPQIDESQFPKSSSPLTDLNIIIGDSTELSTLVYRFQEHISQEWFEPWDSFNWVVNNFVPRMLEVVMGSGLSMPKVITQLCSCFFTLSRTFGKVFVEKKVRPKFIDLLIQTDDEDLNASMRSKQSAVSTSVVPVYASGVLAAFNTEEDKQQLCQFLQEILCTLSLYQAPLDSLKSAISVLSCDISNHDLLLTVLWDGVVHTSAQVRSSAARLFELMVKGVSETLVSSRVFPALVTLGNDPEISVRTSTIPALGAIIENVTVREMLDRAYMQFLTFMDDPTYRDEHRVHIELIHTLARVGPNTEPKFREEFILPRLAVMALANNHVTDDRKKREIASELFEAYSSMSCCLMNDQLVRETMLPGLRCLQQDMAQTAPEHEEVIQSMIRDYETKMEISRSDRSSSFGQGATGGSDDMKFRMFNKLKDTTNLSSIFNRKK